MTSSRIVAKPQTQSEVETVETQQNRNSKKRKAKDIPWLKNQDKQPVTIGQKRLKLEEGAIKSNTEDKVEILNTNAEVVI